MGQAKLRGSRGARIEEARTLYAAKFPSSVKCYSCQADLTEITPLSTKGRPGIWLLGKAKCHPCDCVTWVVEGEPDAVVKLRFSPDGVED